MSFLVSNYNFWNGKEKIHRAKKDGRKRSKFFGPAFSVHIDWNTQSCMKTEIPFSVLTVATQPKLIILITRIRKVLF